MAERKDRYKVRITEPTVVCPVDGERTHAVPGEVLDLPAEDVFNLVGGGKAVIVDDAAPVGLPKKPAPKEG